MTHLPPFASGTVSVGLYSTSSEATESLSNLFDQARAARDAGFHGVTVSEHHAGFPSYFPNPIQLCGWVLDRVEDVWAGACPVVLPLRPAGIVAEEIAWLRVLHPDRVALGVAPGYAAADFDVIGGDHESRADTFRDQLARLAALLSGDADPLDRDLAIAALKQTPVPLVAAAGSPAAARRAARAGAGIITDSLANTSDVRARFDAHRDAGGTGPRVVNRRAWIGAIPDALVARQFATWDRAGVTDDGTPVSSDVIAGDAVEVAERLLQVMEETGADHLGLKVFLEGLSEREVLEQLAAFEPTLDRFSRAIGRR